jgi:hypothetical protein
MVVLPGLSDPDRTNPTAHSGRSVLPNRSVRYFGTGVNSVPDEIGTDRFQKIFGTEVIRFRYFRFGIGKYRKYRTGKTACNIKLNSKF